MDTGSIGQGMWPPDEFISLEMHLEAHHHTSMERLLLDSGYTLPLKCGQNLAKGSLVFELDSYCRSVDDMNSHRGQMPWPMSPVQWEATYLQ